MKSIHSMLDKFDVQKTIPKRKSFQGDAKILSISNRCGPEVFSQLECESQNGRTATGIWAADPKGSGLHNKISDVRYTTLHSTIVQSSGRSDVFQMLTFLISPLPNFLCPICCPSSISLSLYRVCYLKLHLPVKKF